MSSTPQTPASPPAPTPAQQPGRPSAPQIAVPMRQPGSFKRGFGLGAGAGIGFGLAALVLGTVLSVVAGLILLAGAAATAGMTETVTIVWGPAAAGKTLRAVDVKGPILTDKDGGALLTGGTYGYEVARVIDGLEAEDADGLILRLNTPGGTITGSKAIADAMDRYRDRTGHKVFAHVQGMSASGGMYAMAGADDIRADYGSFVGSIGVIMGPFARYRDVVALDGGLLGGGVTTTGGIEESYLTQGRGKDAGNPYRDLTDEERSVLTTGLEDEYAAFVDHVSAKRGIPAAVIRDDLGAHIYGNRVAEEKQLIDGTMGIEDAYRHFAALADLDPADTRVVAATKPSTWETLLSSEARVTGHALPVEVTAGVRPVTAPLMCGPTAIVAYHGDSQRVCG